MATFIEGSGYYLGDTVTVLVRPARFMPQPSEDETEVWGHVTFIGKCKSLEVAQSRGYYAKSQDGYLYADKVRVIEPFDHGGKENGKKQKRK